MINAIVGRPRSGKSYESVVFHIIPAALECRLVVTNVVMNLDEVAKFYGEEVAKRIIIVKTNFNEYGSLRPFSVPEDFTKYDWKNEKGQGPLFVIDEAHLSLGSDCKTEVREYLSLHGHYGHDIILLTQSPRKIHKDVKDMIEICWRCVKKSVFGDDTHYIKKTYHGVVIRNEDFVHEEEREYKKQYFPFYVSHTQSQMSVVEATAKDIKANLFPHKKLVIVMLVLGTLFAVSSMVKFMKQSTDKADPKHKADQANQVTNPIANSSVLSSAAASEQVPRSDNVPNGHNKIKNHPFYKVDLHIDGTAIYTDKKHLIKQVYFTASQNGQAIFTLTLADLRLAGYETTVYGDCSVLITYGSYTDWITCDSPQVTSDVPQTAANIVGSGD